MGIVTRVRSTRTGEVGRCISHGEHHKHTLRQLQNAYYLHDTVINSNLAYPLGLSQQKSSALRMITGCHHTMKRYLRSSTVNLVAVPLEPSSPNADSTIFLFFSCPVKYSHLANINVKKSSMLVTPIDLRANIELLNKRDWHCMWCTWVIVDCSCNVISHEKVAQNWSTGVDFHIGRLGDHIRHKMTNQDWDEKHENFDYLLWLIDYSF